MTDYQRQLIAYGVSPEQAARDSWANELQRWANREHASYGVYDPDPPSPEEVQAAYSEKYEA